MKSLLIFFCIANFLQDAQGRDWYFDSQAAEGGNGQLDNPYNTLSVISSLQLSPGDQILLKRGTRFNESLELNQSGSAQSPLTVGSFGDTASPLPVVAAEPDVLTSVLLDSTSNIILQDLEITNPGNNQTARRGVYVYAKDKGQVSNVTLRRLYIHDVTGYMPSTTIGGLGVGKYANASGGIVVEATGNTTPTYFTGITIEDNFIKSVGRQGIYTWSNWCRRDALAAFWYPLCSQPWQASTNLVITRNRLVNIGGDGIVVTGNIGALVTYNRVTIFNNGSNSNNAGIWTANSDDSIFRYNAVSGGKTTRDGMAYDVDHSSSGTIFEFNVSHDNEGGFFLICPYNTPVKNFTIRYNLSVNDRARIIEICSGDLEGGKIYKNTIAIGNGLSPRIVQSSSGLSLDTLFANNIVRKEGSGNSQWILDSPQFSVSNNIFFGSIDTYPNATSSINAAPGLVAPGLRHPEAYLLLANSPAIDSASVVAGDEGQDFFGNDEGSNIGFYGGQATPYAQWISSFDNSDYSAWTTTGTVASVSDPAGFLGRSISLAPGSTFSRSYQATTSGIRFKARIWFDSPASGSQYPSIGVGGRSALFSGLANFRFGTWQYLQVVEKAGVVEVTLDGDSTLIPTLEDTVSQGKVVFSAGNYQLYVDDAFVAPL